MLQQVLADPKWAKKLTDEDRRGLTALFWSNVNPYGTFRLDMDKRLDLALPIAVPHPRVAEAATAERALSKSWADSDPWAGSVPN
ncbi:hypothetical protein RKD38_000015 [Streptomyces ambofaciens]